MKKYLIAAAISASVLLVGCGNKQVFDTNWTFDRAIITVGDEVIEVKVKTWTDYSEGDTSVQIVTEDGTVYLTDKKNVVLIGK